MVGSGDRLEKEASYRCGQNYQKGTHEGLDRGLFYYVHHIKLQKLVVCHKNVLVLGYGGTVSCSCFPVP